MRSLSKEKAILDLMIPDQAYRVFIETMSDGALYLSKNGIILYCNKRFSEMVRVPQEKILQTPLLNYIKEDQRDRLLHMMKKSTSKKEEFQLITNNEMMTVYLSLQLVSVKNIQSFCVLITDITEKVVMQRYLEISNKKFEEALKSKDNFLTAMSHNLRTPLNSMMGFTDLLLMQVPGPINKEQERQLKIISKGSTHLLNLINKLLDFSGDATSSKLIPEKIEINGFIKVLLKEFEDLAKNKHLRLNFSPVEFQLFIYVDKRVVRQIIAHIIDNAIKYTNRGYVKVNETILSYPHGKYLEIQVADTGIGIEKNKLNKIFDDYSDFSENAEIVEHRGIGLHVCRKLCAVLGWELHCQSILGKGTTIFIHIPLAQ